MSITVIILWVFVTRYFAQTVVFFREIEGLKAYKVKLALQNSIFDIFGAKMHKSCPNMPKSREYEDFKSVEKPEIHWTQP